MANRHAFVAEVAVDFKDAFKTADHEALQIQFRRDSQVHIHIERIVVRDKGFCIGAARDRVEHRRFHFKEAVIEHEGADGGNGLRAGEEAVARFLIHDEVDVALTVAKLRVLQALVLIGQRTDALGHQTDFFHANGEVAGMGAEKHALGSNDVAQVERLKGSIGVGANFILLHEVLHRAGEVAHRAEGGLAHDALEHDAA